MKREYKRGEKEEGTEWQKELQLQPQKSPSLFVEQMFIRVD